MKRMSLYILCWVVANGLSQTSLFAQHEAVQDSNHLLTESFAAGDAGYSQAGHVGPQAEGFEAGEAVQTGFSLEKPHLQFSQVFSQSNGPPFTPSVRLTGFFQADWGWFAQDAANRATLAMPGDTGDIQDGGDFRRARLAAVGNVAENVSYSLEMDFAFPGRPSFMDVWLQISDLPVLGNLRVGQFREPFGMDALTSVKELTFLERALPFAFLPFRQIGVQSQNYSDDELMSLTVSAFRFPTDTFGGSIGDDGGYSMSSRATWVPFYENDGQQMLHLGFDYAFINSANNTYRYRNQPEFFVGETGGADITPAGVPSNVPFFVDTMPINARHVNQLGVEYGTVWGSLYTQSEGYVVLVDQIGGPSLVFSGYYSQIGYFLTGEVRSYNKGSATFGRVKPIENFGKNCGIGAWEIAGRWSQIDLNDQNIGGGRLDDLTLGINWYLNQFTKFQLNYIHAFLDRPPVGNSNADIVAVRAQVDF